MKEIKEIKVIKEMNLIRIGYIEDGKPGSLVLQYSKFNSYPIYVLEYYINKECV